MARNKSNVENNGKGVQTREASLKGAPSHSELESKQNVVKYFGAKSAFPYKTAYATNPNSNSTKNKYYELKNKAVNTYNKGEDQKRKGVAEVSVGSILKGHASKAKSKVQDAYAEAYGKIVGAKNDNKYSNKNTTQTTKSSSSNNKTATKKSAKNNENWVETDDSVDGVTTKTSYGSRTIHQSGDKIYDNKYLKKEGITMTGIKGNQPTKGKNALNGSVSPYTKSEMKIPSDDKSYNEAYKKSMTSSTQKKKKRTGSSGSTKGASTARIAPPSDDGTPLGRM